MLKQGFKTNKTLIPFVATSTSIATGTSLTLKTLDGTTITIASTDVVAISSMSVGDAAGAGGTFQLQTTTDSLPLLVLVAPSFGGGGIISITPHMPLTLPAGKTVKFVGTANGFVNVIGYILR